MKGLAIGFLAGSMVIAILTPFIIKEVLPQTRTIECKPCKCLSNYKLRYYSSKYELYVDSMEYGSKKDKSRYTDSVRKFGEILRQND